jgi:hypothetical protein
MYGSRSPSLTNNLSIWASWGDAASSGQQAYTTNGAVWTGGYLGVWHMGEAGNAPADSALQGAGDNTGVDGGTDGTVTAAKIGDGYDYSGTGLVEIGNYANVSGLTNATISFWYYKRSRGGGNYGSMFGSDGSYSWGLRHHLTDSLDLLANGSYLTGQGNLSNAAWHYLTYVFDDAGDRWDAYLNGALVNSPSTSEAWLDPRYLVGINGVDERAPDGIIDEVRLSGASAGSNWVWACWMNQGDNHATFVEYGVPVQGALASGSVDVSSGWFPAGTNITVTATSEAGSEFDSWGGDTNGCVIVANVITVPMFGPRAIQAQFVELPDEFTLTVTSSHGTASPLGVTTNTGGSLINAYVLDSPIASGATQYVCTGWAGAGSLADGSGTNTSFTITNDTTMSWQWQTNYWINFQTFGE